MYADACSFYLPALVNLDATAVDPDERSARMAGFTPPAPVELQHPVVVDGPLAGAADAVPVDDAQAAAPEGDLVVTSQDSAAAAPEAAPPPPDNLPKVTFDVVVSAVTGVPEPVLPEIQSVEVNGERVPARERTAAEKKGSMFWLSMRLPAPYQHLLLESQPVSWSAPLVFSTLQLSNTEGSAASAGDKLQLPCNTRTRDCLRDGFMTLRVMQKTPEAPPQLTDAELEEIQAVLPAHRSCVLKNVH